MLSITCYSQTLKRLTHISYNVNEGLLQSQVTNIAEDGNGMIWISCGSGVQKFDGRSFKQVSVTKDNRGIPYDRQVKLFSMQNGNLVLSSQAGISEYDISTNRFKHFSNLPPVKSEAYGIIEQQQNKLWIWLNGKGIACYDKEKQQLTDSLYFPLPYHLQTIFPVRPLQGSPLLLVLGGLNLYIANRQTGRIDSISPSALQQKFYTALQCNKDTLLVATKKGWEILHYPSLTFQSSIPYKTNPVSVNREHPVQVSKTGEQLYLVSEGRELFELDLRSSQYSSRLTNLHNEPFTAVGYITGLFTDSHQNLWLLTENTGIHKVNYRFAGFRYYGNNNGSNNFVKTILADKADNRVLCGIFGGGLQVFDTMQHFLKSITEFPGEPSPVTVGAFHKAGPHQYLVFLMGSWNVYELNTINYSLKKIKINTSGINRHIQEKTFPDYHLTVHPLNDSSLLMQSSFYLYGLKLSPSQMSVSLLDSFDQATVSSFADKQESVWIGSHGKYYQIKKDLDGHHSFHLPGKIITRCFYTDASDTVWMGTENGLYLLDANGKIIRHLRSVDGLPDENIFAIRKDKQHNTWFSHSKGISCRKHDGQFLHFNKNDGLQENEFNTNTSFETEDGELFFGGVNGVSSFYPATITQVQENPGLLISGIRVKDKLWENDTAYWNIRQMVLPYNNNSIAFDLVAIGNRTPEQYNYQYQLVNHDPEWVNAGNNPAVRYVLQPGKYVFRYYASNSFENNPAGFKEITVIVKPPFWKTIWFMSVAALALLICIILITRYISQIKLRKRIGELERRRAMDEERLRISREMHDDIGSGLTQITMISEAAKTSDHQQELLGKIGDTSRKLVSSMSEIIWSMNPENNTLGQLLSYLREQLNKLLEYSGIQYTIQFPENTDHILLDNAQRRNLLLITKELVHNVIKHSGAKKLSVQCAADDNQLIFVITDDGRGFDANQKSSGNGLRNIRRRIDELGGDLSIHSTAGNTIICYSVKVQGTRFKEQEI